MNKILLIAGALVFGAFSANAQCEQWLLPAQDQGYNDFQPAPCTGESSEVEFSVPSSLAFASDLTTGAEYAFSLCNGPDAGAWVPDFTIIAPSGAIDASGVDADECTITFTASETGTYFLVINAEGSCGVDNEIAGGWPMFTTVSGGADCPPPAVMIPGAESFEGGVLPDCWMTMDEDGDGFGFELLEENALAFDGDFSMTSYSWVDVPLNPDNYLITPLLELGTNDSLYYVIRAADPDFPAENYSVLVSTTGTDIADFTDEVFTEVLASNVYEGRSIDLSAYDGQSIYIAFRHFNVSDEFFFLMDAVKLPGTVICSPDAVFNPEVLENIVIYPNPSNGVFNIMNSGDAEQYVVRVFDITGKEVKADNVMLNNGSQYQIDLTSFSDGVYTVQFVSTNNTGSLRVVKN